MVIIHTVIVHILQMCKLRHRITKLSKLTNITQLVSVGAVIQTGQTGTTVHPVTLNLLCYIALLFVSVHSI